MIREVLKKLAETEGSPSALEVERLSRLGKPDLEELHAEWPSVPSDRRKAILELAVQLAENDIEMDFGSVFKHALDDPNGQVRAVAIGGLWEDEEFRTADRLAVMLREDPVESVRVAAALGLARFALLGDAGSLYRASAHRVRTALLAAATDLNEAVAVRRRSIEALGVYNEPAVVEIIAAAYADADPAMRASAVYAMGRSCDGRWLDTILHELQSESAEMRFEAARAAGELEARRALVLLVTLLDDPDLEVRLAAVDALANIGGDMAHKALQRCVVGSDEGLRAAAKEALSRMSIGDDPLSVSPFLDDSTRTI